MKSVLAACVAVLLAAPSGATAQAQRADAVLLVNSQSSSYGDAAKFVQPYLENFGVPYTTVDVSTTAIDASIGSYALIIIGHRQLDVAGTYLDASEQTVLANAVRAGTGLVSFDDDLSADGASGRYAFVQDLFGFGYQTPGVGTDVTFTSAAPGHYVSSRHAAGEAISSASTATASITTGAATALVTFADGSPLVAVATRGQGRAVQWGSYAWMSHNVLGPLSGLDDLVWRGFAWAARKPFVMRLIPNLATMRIDDVSGYPLSSDSLWWLRTTVTQSPFRPWAGTFYSQIPSADADYLGQLVRAGLATSSVHSGYSGNDFYFILQAPKGDLPDATVAANFADATAWHNAHNIPISKFVVPHVYEFGSNVFGGLRDWGVEFVGAMVTPGSDYYGPTWIAGGPYRLYEFLRATRAINLAYADYVPTIPNHPEFDNQFFNCVTEIRTITGYEWYPSNDTTTTISNGTREMRRAFDSKVLATLFTHESYIQQTDPANYERGLTGVVQGIAEYAPVYVTMDYACQYLRAKHNSRIVSSTFDPATQQLTATVTGATDLATQLYVFAGADLAISQTPVSIPVFSGTTQVTQQLAGAVDHVVITPSAATVPTGGTVTFAAQAYDAAGNAVQGVTYVWSASAGGTITQAGFFTAGATAGTFADAVSVTVGGVAASASVTVYAPRVEHFLVTGIGAVYAGSPFTVTVGAYDQWGAALPSFAGTVQLSDLTGSISPTLISGFSSGTWTGSLTIATSTTNDVITATSGSASGTSAAFDVQPPVSGRSLWEPTAVPGVADHGASDPVELGVKFTSDEPGYISAVRFYKAAANTGTHVAHLWSSAGALLATATFMNETASGWQQATLSPPIAIAANTVYVASYHTEVGHYAGDGGYFATAGQDAAPLHAPYAGGPAGGNGVYAYGSAGTFPSSSYNGTNYWVDVVFGAAPPAIPASVVVSPSAATVGTGGTQQFTAQAYDDLGNPLAVGFTWSTTGGGTIDQSGLFTAGSTPGAFTGNVVATASGVSGTASTTVAARTLSRFDVASISTARVGQAFAVQVTARDQFGAVLTGYAGPAALSVSAGSVTPAATGAFSAGVWTGSVTISAPATGVVLTVSDGAATGASNAFDVLPSGTDLRVTALTDPPATAVPGATFSVTDTTANAGDLAAAASTTRYYLSSDAVKDVSDLLIGARALGVLAGGGSSSATVTVSVPAALGAYYLLACADDLGVVSETDETNNCRVAAGRVTISAPDLVTTTLSAPPTAANAGSAFTVSDTVANQGNVAAGATTTRYYLSLDGTWSAADVLLAGSRSVPALDPAGTSNAIVTVTIPSGTAQGTYYLLACADDLGAVAELSESNNCRASSTTVQVTMPDLVVSALSKPPASANAGTVISVTDTTRNQGTGLAAASTTRYYLSADTVHDGSDVLLTGSRDVNSRAAGATSTGTVSVIIPVSTPPGAYYLIACADDLGAVVESNETNNCLTYTGRTMQVAIPDLVITAVSAARTTAAAGTSFSVSYTLANQGSGTAPSSTTRFYLSASGQRDAAAILLTGMSAVSSVSAGGSTSKSRSVTIPAGTAAGTYAVLACADDLEVVVEANETNNCRAAGTTMTVTP